MTSRRKSGFTLTEVMITLTILAVLAGLSVPGYFRTVESSRANEAITTLNIIHMGQKIYRLNNGTFWNGGANACGANPLAPDCSVMRNTLNIDISPAFYTDIDFSGVSANGYECTATRNNVQGGAGSRWYKNTWNHVAGNFTASAGVDGLGAADGVGGNF